MRAGGPAQPLTCLTLASPHCLLTLFDSRIRQVGLHFKVVPARSAPLHRMEDKLSPGTTRRVLAHPGSPAAPPTWTFTSS